MGLIKIDETKCKKDGACTRDCSPDIIRLSEQTGLPEIVPGGDAACIFCGHCVAVCPEGALSHEGFPQEMLPSSTKNLAIDEARAVQFLRSRRSVRLFKERPVEKEKVTRLIELARYAPTAGNSQSVQMAGPYGPGENQCDRRRRRRMAAGGPESRPFHCGCQALHGEGDYHLGLGPRFGTQEGARAHRGFGPERVCLRPGRPYHSPHLP